LCSAEVLLSEDQRIIAAWFKIFFRAAEQIAEARGKTKKDE
jgi:hypothetical protein